MQRGDLFYEVDRVGNSSSSTYTASLSSSVNTFVTEYGRIYHSFRDHQGSLNGPSSTGFFVSD